VQSRTPATKTEAHIYSHSHIDWKFVTYVFSIVTGAQRCPREHARF
jgi:hypothetical protein